MRKHFVAALRLGFLVAVSAAVFSQPQSLQELAKKEKERREKIASATKPITNVEAEKYKNGAISTGAVATPPQAAPKTGEEGEAQPKADAKPDEPVDFQGRPESFWRQTFADARQKVKDLENEGNVLTLRFNDLQNQFYREASGFRQQEIQRDIQKTIYEQDKNKQDLAKAKDQLADLEKEARKSGALPGWMTPKTP